MSIHSVWGASAPSAPLAGFTDGTPGIRTATTFYLYGGASGACVGGRLYIPPAAVASLPAQVTLWARRVTGGDISFDPPERSAVVAIPAGGGWVEVAWAALPLASAQYVLIGSTMGAAYIHAPGLQADPVTAPGFSLALAGNIESVSRAHFQMSGGAVTFSTGAYYGHDILVDDLTTGPPPNQAPTANAGPDRTAVAGSLVTLTASSSDADGTVVSHVWVQTAGAPVVLTGTGPTRTFTAPDIAGPLTFRLTVTDDDGAQSQDSVTVTVSIPPPTPAPTGDLLDEADLAFMRETQAATRPTEAELRRRAQGTSASGGRTDTFSDPTPVDIRLDGKETDVPASVTAVLGGGKPVKITMDLVEVRSGDTLTVSPTEVYQVVTDGDPDRWATAQVVWAKRIKWPARG